MNFDLSTEDKQIQNLARKFSQEKIIPQAQKYDELEKLPIEIFKEAWELGLINTCINEQSGGLGLTPLQGSLVCEQLGYGCLGMNTSFMANDLALLPLVLAGSLEQKKKFLVPFTEEFKLASFCLTEPEHGSDAAGIKTIFKQKANSYFITGEKMWITNAGHADLFVVYGTLDPKLRHKGITVALVESSLPGIKIGKREKKMGQRCSDTRSVSFTNVEIPKDNILGKPGEGWSIAKKTLCHSRPMVAASALGGAQRAFDEAKKYSQERQQFGKPLASFQLIQKMLADMAIQVEAAKLLTYQAAWMLEKNLDNTKQASFAKAFAADACMQIATDAVQILGGYGYSREFPVEKIFRDAKLLQIYEGTSQIQRLVIAKEILSEENS